MVLATQPDHEIEVTKDNLSQMGYTYDPSFRGWYNEESARSSMTDRGDGRGFVPNYHRLYIPPFGMTDLMIRNGLRLWVDDNFKITRFKF